MDIQFIYTFHTREQVFVNAEITPDVLSSKKTLMEEVMKHLKKVEKAELVKISCCVFNTGDLECPDWYIAMNGKFWLDDIEGYRFANGIKSSIPISYIVEWLADNNETLKLDWV